MTESGRRWWAVAAFVAVVWAAPASAAPSPVSPSPVRPSPAASQGRAAVSPNPTAASTPTAPVQGPAAPRHTSPPARTPARPSASARPAPPPERGGGGLPAWAAGIAGLLVGVPTGAFGLRAVQARQARARPVALGYGRAPAAPVSRAAPPGRAPAPVPATCRVLLSDADAAWLPAGATAGVARTVLAPDGYVLLDNGLTVFGHADPPSTADSTTHVVVTRRNRWN